MMDFETVKTYPIFSELKAYIMKDTLETLTAREQLMEDIISIVEEQLPDQDVGRLEQLLCDAVCKNFPIPY